MPPNPTPDLTFSEKQTLIQTAPVAIAQKLYYGWVANELLSYDEFYTLFNILKLRLP
jgi:hypothetical protein